MIAAVALVLALNTPAPQEKAPLKTIIDVHSETPLCATLHQTVAPVFFGLMKDDQVIEADQQAINEYAA